MQLHDRLPVNYVVPTAGADPGGGGVRNPPPPFFFFGGGGGPPNFIKKRGEKCRDCNAF